MRRATVVAALVVLIGVATGCGETFENEPLTTDVPDTTIAVVQGTNPTTLPPRELGTVGVQAIIDLLDQRTGEAYRLAAGRKTVPARSRSLLAQAYSGSALAAQRTSLEDLVSSNSLASSPSDPKLFVLGVQEETASCAVAAVRVDDRGLYAFPDSVEVLDAVVQLRRIRNDWRIVSLIQAGTPGLDELSCP